MMNNKISFFTPLLAAFAVLFFASSLYASVGMPHFSLANVLDGRKVDSSAFTGKALLVTFFATWCPPCRKEVPDLKRLQRKFAGDGFSVLALSVDQGESRATVAAFVEKEEINYPVLMATYETSRDFGGIFGLPTAFLVNKNGNIVKKYQGYVFYPTLEKDVAGIVQ